MGWVIYRTCGGIVGRGAGAFRERNWGFFIQKNSFSGREAEIESSSWLAEGLDGGQAGNKVILKRLMLFSPSYSTFFAIMLI